MNGIVMNLSEIVVYYLTYLRINWRLSHNLRDTIRVRLFKYGGYNVRTIHSYRDVDW